MKILIIGLFIWCGTHFIPALAIKFRQQLMQSWGEKKYKIIFSLLIVLSITIMVVGWRSTEVIILYNPPIWAAHVTGILVITTFILFSAARSETTIKRYIRHPQLAGLILWSIGHLLANGDNRSLLLFAGLGTWAIAEIILISKREGSWVKPPPATFKSEIMMVGKGILLFLVFLFAHPYLSGVTLL